MSRSVILAATCSFLLLSSGANAAPVDDKAVLMQLEQGGCDAYIRGDMALLATIYADEYTMLGADGSTSTKKDALTPPAEKPSICKVDQLRVQVYENSAVVFGRSTYADSKGAAQYRYVDSYVRRDGRWQCVAAAQVLLK